LISRRLIKIEDFLQLKQNLRNDFAKFKAIKLAVLGDISTQFLIQALRGTGFSHEFDLQILEVDFKQIER